MAEIVMRSGILATTGIATKNLIPVRNWILTWTFCLILRPQKGREKHNNVCEGLHKETKPHSLLGRKLCYVMWLFVKRLSQRRSQHDRFVKIKVFKLRGDADDIPCSEHYQLPQKSLFEW